MLPRAKKSFSQNFLVDQSVVQKILAAAEIQKGETVLEIGPGTGVLTEALIDAGAKVIAIEADKDLLPALREQFKGIELIEGDALSVALSVKDGEYKLVANLPYNITSAVLEKFLAHSPRPTRMVLMVQKEVADRITAKPPKLSLLSVVCQLYASVSKVANVPAGAFRPVPKVDSAVVRFDLFDKIDREEVEATIRLAKSGFASRRKQLQGNLAAAGFGSAAEIKQKLKEIGLDPRVRAENLTPADWQRLYQQF